MGIDAVPASIDGSANTLLELAGLLQAGRSEPTLTGRTAAPNAHADVDRVSQDFASFALDQYEDVVALLGALSTRLSQVSGSYQQTDQATGATMDAFLRGGRYQPGR
jgi:hypothetical protein